MTVAVVKSKPMRQVETVRENRQLEFLEYGIELPFGLLRSTRQHILTPLPEGNCAYQSVFSLKGPLAIFPKLLLGKNLLRGFTEMTDAIKARAEHLV